jgi:hypothetical protein
MRIQTAAAVCVALITAGSPASHPAASVSHAGAPASHESALAGHESAPAGDPGTLASHADHAQPQDARAADVMASTRKAIDAGKLDELKSLSVQAAMERNIGNFRMNSDVEMLIEMPDKYLRAETPNGGMAAMTSTLGFNGDRPLKAASAPGLAPGGGVFFRMVGPGGPPVAPNDKPTPEQQQQTARAMVRSSKQDVSRLMLGWLGMAHPSLSAQYTYGGEAESPDGKAKVIDVKGADGFAARLFVDEQTKLPLMVTYQARQARIITPGGPPRAAGGAMSARPQPEGRPGPEAAQNQMREPQREPAQMVEHIVYFDDWREVDGIRFPHRMRRSAAGIIVEEWSINKVRVNPKIDPKKFEVEG